MQWIPRRPEEHKPIKKISLAVKLTKQSKCNIDITAHFSRIPHIIVKFHVATGRSIIRPTPLQNFHPHIIRRSKSKHPEIARICVHAHLSNVTTCFEKPQSYSPPLSEHCSNPSLNPTPDHPLCDFNVRPGTANKNFNLERSIVLKPIVHHHFHPFPLTQTWTLPLLASSTLTLFKPARSAAFPISDIQKSQTDLPRTTILISCPLVRPASNAC